MSVWEFVNTLLIGPLKLLFEVIFQLINSRIDNPGLTIVFLSLSINLLVLPLYRRADAMQEQARDTEAKLARGAAQIKKVFSGDERMMILQTYYRQNNYKPTDALNGTVSLLLEIPFFMAAYQFLSGLTALQGASFGPIADLSACDRLLPIGSIRLNLLPFVMTAINLVSCWIYLRGFPLKTKIQLYGMALFFLVLLYRSPSGLVFYWTLNNLFSLGKNIAGKLKAARKPAAPPAAQARRTGAPPDGRVFLAGAVFVTLLIGLLIPSNFIAASPQEYVDVTYFYHPLWYIARTLTMAAGTFLIWMRVFYWLAGPRGKVFFDRFVWVMSGLALVNYMFFGTRLGVISSTLRYENGMSFTAGEQIVNLAVLAAAAAAMLVLIAAYRRLAVPVLLAASAAIGVMSAVNLKDISASVQRLRLDQTDEKAHFELSATGKNVIVVMLDRGMGEYFPYMMQEKPELRELLAGFTYYPNTISFGPATNVGAPALMGGYEYTPVELNRRSDELLVDKHNESLLVMPVLFGKQGYEVTVCDPPLVNYDWDPDLSIYEQYPEIHAYITRGQYSSQLEKQQIIDNNCRNFFCFSVMKCLPLCLQGTAYDEARYNQAAGKDDVSYTIQTFLWMSAAKGLYSLFTEPYYALCNLPEMTNVTQQDKNTYLLFVNETAHDPMLLQTPDYVPALYVDNAAYDAQHEDRFTVDGRTLKIENDLQMTHYHANMSALLRLCEWFETLRQQGVYDNTRIIIASDHGRCMHQLEDLEFGGDESDYMYDVEFYYPLLLVKDFGASEFAVSEEFMTNADVPALATAGVIENPVNPFTGKRITNDEKYAHDQYISMCYNIDLTVNNGTAFLPSKWIRVHFENGLWKRENWEFYEKEIVLREHAFPND